MARPARVQGPLDPTRVAFDVIRLDSLGVRLIDRRRGDRRWVVHGISLDVPRGCIFGLIGPGAAGKSVLLKTLAGLLPVEAGRVDLDGVDVGEASALELEALRRRIGMAFQNNALFDHMTVAENVSFPLRRLFTPTEEEVRAKVAERLACVTLPGFEERMPPGLSGGQKKRVAFARATITKPPILLLDEPAAGLDPVTSQRLFDLVRKDVKSSRATCVIVSSDLDRLLPICDRVGVLVGGELLFEGTVEAAKASMDARVHQFVHGLPDGPL
jgi:phospholipid/cholesterol/gamma-HCH transport system ATP-binding protein